MEKIYLILPGCDDRNRGDQALIWETVDIAKKAGYIGQYYMLADDDKGHQSKRFGIKNCNLVLEHPSKSIKKHNSNVKYSVMLKLRWGINGIFDIITRELLVHNWGRKIFKNLYNDEVRKSIKIFENADSCFVKGGGFLHAYGGFIDTYKIYYFLYHIRLALSFGKDVYIMPNSFGPFKSPFVKRMMNKTLSRCKVVMARENISQKQLKEECNVYSHLFTDIAFHLSFDESFDSKSELKNCGVPIDKKKCVGITMRPYRFTGENNAEFLYSKYKKSLKDLIVYLNSNDYYPVLIEHVYDEKGHENDMLCINEVRSILPDYCEYSIFSNRELNCQEMKKIYSEFYCLVGTRFHSVIFSLSSFVPSLAITYGGNKGDGIMEDIGLEEYAIPIDKIDSENLINKFELLVNNYSKVVDTLDKKVPEFASQVSEISSLIKSN